MPGALLPLSVGRSVLSQRPMETRDLGLPVAAIALREGVPVYDRDDERIGVVEHVLID